MASVRVKTLDEAFKVTRKKGMQIEPAARHEWLKPRVVLEVMRLRAEHNVPLGDGLFEQVGKNNQQGGRVGDLLRPREPLARTATNYRKFVAIPAAGFIDDRRQQSAMEALSLQIRHYRNIIRRMAKQTQILQSFQSRLRGSIEFMDENGGGPGVRLRRRQRAKK